MAAAGETRAGFDPAAVRAWIGLTEEVKGAVETCPNAHTDHTCRGGQ
jgi:hypothetical protein